MEFTFKKIQTKTIAWYLNRRKQGLHRNDHGLSLIGGKWYSVFNLHWPK